MPSKKRSISRALIILLITYCLASLVHFIHNAEFLQAYPGLPPSWTRLGVYLAWLAMTTLGGLGYLVLLRVNKVAGLLLIMVYAFLGLDSLAHYIVAPMAAHTLAMNSTILLEVTASAALLAEVFRLLLVPGGKI